MDASKDQERRAEENKDVLARFKRGESLARCDQQATWWQPRPMVKKDEAAMQRVYGGPARPKPKRRGV